MKGSCLCGAVAWATDAAPRAPLACHCSQCRKQSGHYWAASRLPAEALRIEGEVRWYRASDAARRGFCPVCGSFLFWQPLEGGEPASVISVGCGSVDGPSGLPPERHIFTAEKGDYYALPAGEATHAGDWDDPEGPS